MSAPLRFPYLPSGGTSGSLMPRLPVTLRLGDRAVETIGLLDTGSAINLLPHHIGLALGARWEEQATPVPLTGSLGHVAARALIVLAEHARLTPTPVRFVFAWAQTDAVPVVFGQVNFFLTFDVCFFRREAAFEIRAQ